MDINGQHITPPIPVEGIVHPKMQMLSSSTHSYVQNCMSLNEWCIYTARYCVLLYTQSALQSCGGSLLNHHYCAASTWMMRRLPQHNGASALTTHQLQMERRVIEPIPKWMGIIRRPWLTRASGGNLARTPGLQLCSLREVPWVASLFLVSFLT